MLVLIFFYPQIGRICEIRGTLSAAKGFFVLVHFHVSLDQQDLQIWSNIKSSQMVFHVGLDFHVSSDLQI